MCECAVGRTPVVCAWANVRCVRVDIGGCRRYTVHVICCVWQSDVVWCGVSVNTYVGDGCGEVVCVCGWVGVGVGVRVCAHRLYVFKACVCLCVCVCIDV